ncbi:hypothetical protein QQF64_018578 [Cirrhinus molitorella]|uniref:Uncharacterized protein n=1 Tax=Cirrhinus molitorella TaxID=172907 RepID=A0ABR3LGI1_9TELE
MAKRCLSSFTFHVACRGANLMGLDLLSALGFSLVDSKGAAILTVSTPWQQKWPSLFEGLGCLTAFTHQPLLNPAIKPVIQLLRCIPLALCDGVLTELKQLLDSGIVEPMYESPWVSNLEVAQKKSGALRVCRPVAVNKASDPDPYLRRGLIAPQFSGFICFLKLISTGYLQFLSTPAAETSQAFRVPCRLFRYTRMLLGLSSAPSCFQKIMVSVLAGIPAHPRESRRTPQHCFCSPS